MPSEAHNAHQGTGVEVGAHLVAIPHVLGQVVLVLSFVTWMCAALSVVWLWCWMHEALSLMWHMWVEAWCVMLRAGEWDGVWWVLWAAILWFVKLGMLVVSSVTWHMMG